MRQTLPLHPSRDIRTFLSRVLTCCAILLAAAVAAPVWAADLAPFPLWAGKAPGAHGTGPDDIPTLTPFLPEPGVATGAAMVICPGGSYAGLADHEGAGYARWLAAHGVAGFVLKYRLGSHGYHHPAMINDASRAVRLVRARADEWKLDTHRIGIMGSSAGGHLASTLLTHFTAGDPKASDPVERESSRPDLGVLCYPVITMGPDGHDFSKLNLLGENPSPALVRLLSNELQVTPQTPPCFIWATYEDSAVKIENSLSFAMALRKAGVPFDLHIYEKGGHGMGLGNNHPWGNACLYWLAIRNFVKP